MTAKQLHKGLVRFVNHNFPDPDLVEFLEESEDLSKIKLKYGKEILFIKVGYDKSTTAVFKLIDTIYQGEGR